MACSVFEYSNGPIINEENHFLSKYFKSSHSLVNKTAEDSFIFFNMTSKSLYNKIGIYDLLSK